MKKTARKVKAVQTPKDLLEMAGILKDKSIIDMDINNVIKMEKRAAKKYVVKNFKKSNL